MMDYKQLFEQAINTLCEERRQHEHEVVEAIVKQIELQPLKPNSVYKVKFQEGATLNNVNQVIRFLNEKTKDNNITFIPSCDYFEIMGEEMTN